MSAVDQIVLAEEKVAELQAHLDTVGTVLEKVEQVAVSGRKARRCVRRSFRVFLVISVVAAAVVVVKKVMDSRSSTNGPELVDSGAGDEPDTF